MYPSLMSTLISALNYHLCTSLHYTCVYRWMYVCIYVMYICIRVISGAVLSCQLEFSLDLSGFVYVRE